MLIAFSAENFRSVRDLQTLSMVEPRADRHLEGSNLIEAGGKRLVKTAALFGPSASGKSNILRAMIWLRQFVLTTKAVQSEWLFRKQPTAKAARLFTREGNEFDISHECFPGCEPPAPHRG